jgi:hypothetical protein
LGLDGEGDLVSDGRIGGAAGERLDVQKEIRGPGTLHESEAAIGIPGFDNA